VSGRHCGIYRIDFGNGWYYFGSSKNLLRRKSSHLFQLRKGVHKNKKMQAVYDQTKIYEFTILELCDIAILLDLEQRYLDSCRGDSLNLNICLSAKSPMLGRTHSPEARLKLSNLQKRVHKTRKPPSMETRRRTSESMKRTWAARKYATLKGQVWQQ
jgi:group I intron endonuclease